MSEIFLLEDIGLVIIVASIIAVLAGKFRQPLLLGYVLAGIIIGPAFHIVNDPEPIKILSELGIAFLLFLIGLELDFNKLREVGLNASIIGVLQVTFTTLAGFGIAFLLGFSIMECVAIGLIISFSSTMIVAKMLGEQRELDSLHGQIVLVILIIQDIIAVLVLSFIGTDVNSGNLTNVLLRGLMLIGFFVAIYKLILPTFLKEAVNSTELIFICSLTTMFVFSGMSIYLGYPSSIGAFIAGVALSTTRYSHEIIGRVKPLKDFFLVLFFVVLGMQMVFQNFASMLIPLGVLLLTVMILKPLIIFFIVKKFNYSNRTAFFTGAQLAQVGEFSLVLASLVLVSLVQKPLFSMLIALTIITMLLTAYVIKYDDWLFNRYFSRLLKPFEGKSKKENAQSSTVYKNHIVIYGVHRMSEKIINALKKTKKKFIVVDHNPEKARLLSEQGINFVCSDMTNPEVAELAHLRSASVVISSVHNMAANIALIRTIKHENPKAVVMVASNSEDEALVLYNAGADYVIIPLILGGEKVINYLTHLKPKEIVSWGKKYYAELKKGN